MTSQEMAKIETAEHVPIGAETARKCRARLGFSFKWPKWLLTLPRPTKEMETQN
jgi:hypothetical protein